MASRRRITVLVHALYGGGSEHVAASLANHWQRASNDVTLITLADRESDVIFVDPAVTRRGLGLVADSTSLWQAIRQNCQRVRELRTAIQASQPDCVVSLVDRMNVLTLLASRPMPLPVYVCERTDLRHHQIGRIWDALRRLTYPQARAVVVQTQSVKTAIEQRVPRCKAVVIPNGISPLAPSSRRAQQNSTRPFVIAAVGRLSPAKGFDHLIRSFAQVAPASPDWVLKIVGDGPEREALEELCRSLSIDQSVKFLGWSESPWELLGEADVFALSSRYEGFPNALLEAMARGLAVAAFDCESGPAEIIQHERDGLLVPAGDETALAETLRRLMCDPPLRQRLGQAATAVVDRFSMTRHLQTWDRLLAQPDELLAQTRWH